MCTLLGHLTAGIFLASIGLYWTLKIFGCSFKAQINAGYPKYRNSCFHPWRQTCFIDAYAMIIGFTLKIIAQVLVNFPDVNMHNQQHIAMYAFGAVATTIALQLQKVPVIPNGEYALMALSSAVTALMFSLHHIGSEGYPPENLAHFLVSLNAMGMVLSSLLELAFPIQVLAGLFRAWTFTVFGLWLVATAFYLYPIDDWNTHKLKGDLDVMQVPVLYVLTLLLSIGILVLAGIWQHRRASQDFENDGNMSYKRGIIENEKLLK